MAEFTMPALGADMETGKVVEWLVRPGDRVRSGDVVVVVETHKGAIDVECFLDGVIGELAAVGRVLPVGAVLAQVAVAGEAPAAHPAASPPASPAASPPVSPLANPPASPSASPAAQPAAPAAQAQPAAAVPSAAAARGAAASPAGAAQARVPAGAATRARVSPAARRHAAQLGIDADGLRGTGADGAITRADVELAAAGARPAAAPAPRGGFDPALMRQAIAAAMGRSKREIPHYYLVEPVPLKRALDWLRDANAQRPVTERLLPAVLLIKAAALALRDYPELNGWYEGGAFCPASAVHVGVAVSLRGGGLVAPALRDADAKPLAQLMRELADLVRRCRAGGLRSSELSDPSVTVTNLGDQGVEAVFGVIYPPQVALIGFGGVAERPWVEGGAVLPMPVVTASLAADHRASDGHRGALFLARLRALLQQPEAL